MSSSLPVLPVFRTGPRSLVATGLTRSYAGRTVLDCVDVTASPGTVLAVVGENGTGKSTLLRLLAGLEQPDGGTVSRPADVGHLGQELVVPPGTTVGDVLDDALAAQHAAVARLEELADRLGDAGADHEYAGLLDWAVLHDAWDADRRAEEAASRLGLARVDRGRPVAALSGGERARLALAALLTRRPDCLLLDEPTNHLDDAAVEYVEEVVRQLPGVVVVASHDRVLLDRVADAVLDLDPTHFGADGRGGRLRGGGWSAFLAERERERRRWEQSYAEQQEEIERVREAAATTARRVAPGRGPRDNDKFIHHFKGANVQRTVARRVRDAERRLAVLQRDQVPKPPAPLTFTGTLATGSGAAVQVRDLDVPGRLHLDRLDVAAGERLLVTGANGSGKSTLLRVLAGRLAPAAGEVHVTARRTGYLPQDVRFSRPERSAAVVYSAAVGDGSEDPAVPRLESLGLVHPRDVGRPVGELSTGQQRRLALAVLVARRPDLVLLDEPTNHLSLALAEELEEALGRSPGTVVVASHDRWLRRRWEGSSLGLSPCAG
ncbi:ABC-F family ATP-binding cassette domain-containing protein [Nocardioides caldifontis]|uniref:ABC-F family ATP-binding cassette domain-containing protein n=1 Tax=Nocardioides caldifontis TaxID=2588938 RepID=UPI0011DF2B06|nr:ATP-binding cassette domain-containing protein [Nocardioides caldifontis]